MFSVYQKKLKLQITNLFLDVTEVDIIADSFGMDEGFNSLTNDY